MEEALQHCRNNMGDNATTLDDYNEYSFQDSIRKIAAGAHWDCYSAFEFYGWEAERVVAVTSGSNMMELITRAKTHLSVCFITLNNILFISNQISNIVINRRETH